MDKKVEVMFLPLSAASLLKESVKVKSLSHVQLFVTPWTVAYQAPPPMGFSRQDFQWSGLPLQPLNQGVIEDIKTTYIHLTLGEIHAVLGANLDCSIMDLWKSSTVVV